MAALQNDPEAQKPWLRSTTPNQSLWQTKVNQLLLDEMLRKVGNTLPIEDPASICSIATLNALADDIATARSKEDIDSKLHDFEQAKVTLNQLLTALKGSIRSIRSSWTRTTLDQKKERARLEKLEKAKQDKLAKEKEDLYKQWKTDEAKSALFELDVSAISQPLIQDPSKLQEKGSLPHDLPWAFASVPTLTNVLTEESTFRTTMGRFAEQFASSATCRKAGFCRTLLTKPLGAESAQECYQRAFPSFHTDIEAPLPPMAKNFLESFHFWGFSAELMHFAREELDVSWLRFVAGGAVQILATRVEDIAQYIAQPGQVLVPMEEVNHFLSSATASVLENYVKAGNTLYNGIVGLGGVWFMPAGFAVAYKPVKKQRAHGFAKPLAFTTCQNRSLQFITAAQPPSASPRLVDCIMQALLVRTGAQANMENAEKVKCL